MSVQAPPPPNRPSSGVGGPFVILMILGVAIGVAVGEPTIGFLGGLAAGGLAGVLLYLRDRRR